MTSKIFSNKQNSALGLFLFTIRQNIGLIIMSVIGTLLLCPGYLLIEVNEYHDRMSKAFYELNSVISYFGIAACVVGVIGIVVYNIINFSYLYSKKSSDVFHSLPLTRTELLLARSLAGFVSVMIPIIIGYIAVLSIVLFTPWIIADLEILAVLFMYNIFVMLIAWSMSLLFMICAGTVFDYALSIGIVNGGLLIFPHIISVFAEKFLLGFGYSVPDNLLKCSSPIYYYVFTIGDFMNRTSKYQIGYAYKKPPLFNSNEVIAIVVTVLLLAVLLTASILLYKRRNAEKAGNAYAFKFVYIVSNLLLSFEVGFGVGSIFSDIEPSSPIFWIFSVIGALMASVAFGAISERGFKTYKKSLVVGGVSAAAILLLTAGFAVDVIGYEKRVPEIDKVISVRADVQGFTVELTGKDIEYVTKLHKKLVNEYDIAYEEMEEKIEEYGYNIYYASFEYTLKNGTTLKRNYHAVPSEHFADEMLEVCKFEDVSSLITQIKAEKPKIVQFHGVEQKTDEYFDFTINYEDFIGLLEAYDKSNDKMDKSIFSSNSNFYAGWDTEFYDGSLYSNGYFDFCVGDNYTEFFEAFENIKANYQNYADAEKTVYKD